MLNIGLYLCRKYFSSLFQFSDNILNQIVKIGIIVRYVTGM